MKKEAKILNLCGELSTEVIQYFESRCIQLVDPRAEENSYLWTHILTEDINDFSFIRETYQTIENDIQILSLTPVEDKQNFVLANGKLCLDKGWMKSPLRDFLLDKYFQSYIESNVLSENYAFHELGHFSVNQFFSFGDQLDRLTKTSFEVGVPGVAVRTYIDHLMMYMAALKNEAKMELPAEITFGDSEFAFGVQIYFSAKRLMLDDVAYCLSSQISRNAEDKLLSNALNFCDFFDLSLVASAQKFSITALWAKDLGVTTPGMMLSWLPPKAKIVSYMSDEIITQPEIKSDPSKHIHLPIPPEEELDRREISRESFSEVISSRITDQVSLEKVTKLLEKEVSDQEIINIIRGSGEEDNDIVILSGLEEQEEVSQIVSGAFDSLESIKQEFYNEKEIVDELVTILKDNHSSLDEGVLQVIPGYLQESLDQFCKAKMIVRDHLTPGQLNEFKQYFMSEKLPQKITVLSENEKGFISDLKTRVERKLSNEFQEENIRIVVEQSKESKPDQLRIKSVFKEALRDSLEAKFDFSQSGFISKKQENIIVKSLSSTLEEDKHVIQKIISNEEGVKPHRPLFATLVSEKEKALSVKLEALEKDKKGLWDKLQAMTMELKALKESKSSVAAIQSKALEASNASVQNQSLDESFVLKKEIQEKLNAKTFTEEDQHRLNELLEKELMLATAVRDEAIQSKKIQIELSHKEVLFSSEIEKLTRQLKARDLILSKSKESIIKIVEKKNAELEAIKNKLNQAQIHLRQENSNVHAVENKHLTIQNENLIKQLEIYKNKVKSLTENLKHKEDVNSPKEEIRKIQIEKIQLENQLNQNKKELHRSSSLLNREMATSKELRAEVAELKEQLKLFEKESSEKKEIDRPVEQQASFISNETESPQLAKIKTLESYVTELESKLTEAQKNQRSSAVDEKRIAHLEGNLKKLGQDLIEARNQVSEIRKDNNKIRSEKNAMKNELERLKKEKSKAKKVA